MVSGAQANVPPPEITSVNTTTIDGSSNVSAVIEVFADVIDEGEYFIGSPPRYLFYPACSA